MTESIADRFRRRAQSFTETVAAVPADRWNAPSPCPDWTARDVLRHVIDTQGMFGGFIGVEFTPGPAIEDDPLGAWTAARDQTQALLDDPATATTEFEGLIGRSTYERAVDGFLGVDQVVHRWDLARAAGVDDTIPAQDVAEVAASAAALAERVGDKMRTGGAFGPALDPPAGADAQTRLLAFLGRQAW
jgi:uncharacterized protein (TIGR03086 family)